MTNFSPLNWLAPGSRLTKLVTWGILAKETYDWGQERLQAHREARSLTVKVSENDPIFQALLQYISDTVPTAQQKVLVAYSSDSVISSDNKSRAQGFKVGADPGSTNVLRIDGYEVRVSVTPSDIRTRTPAIINMNVDSFEARDTVLKLLERLAQDVKSKGSKTKTYSQYGGWDSLSNRPHRPIESVILPAGQKESIMADIQRFLDDEDRYVKLGLPWRRGYLFWGPPGTGKSSTIKVVCDHLGLDLAYLPLSDLKKDSDLIHSIKSLPARSVLLLEDIDGYSKSTGRSEHDDSVSLPGLLNALDGPTSPHGLIIMMTTNVDIESQDNTLDPALLRPGRIDVREKIDYVDSEQLGRLLKYFTQLDLTIDFEPHNLTASEVIGAIFNAERADLPRLVEAWRPT